MVRALTFVAVLASLPCAASTFSLVSDFSATTNPNGVWSYGEASSPTGAFSAYIYTDTDTSPFPAVDYWLNQPFSSGFPNYYPLLRHNATGADIDYGTGFTIPVDMMSFDPGDSLLSGTRFTTPGDGFYTFDGLFRGLQDHSGVLTSTDVFIYENLGTLLFSASIDGTSSSPFSFGLNLAAGDVLDFRVSSRGNNQGDSTGLSINVAGTPAVPEPSTLALIGAGAIAILLKRRPNLG